MSDFSITFHMIKEIWIKLIEIVFQIAVIQFNDEPRTEFNLTDYNDLESLRNATNNIEYMKGHTHTGSGNTILLFKININLLKKLFIYTFSAL